MNCQRVIERRKELWKQNQDLDADRAYIEAVAKGLHDHPHLLAEVKKNPEKLIESVFYIVDKDKRSVPFFLNDVQKDFIDRLNNAIDEFVRGERVHLRFLVLKGRQQGFTSLITAYQLACTIIRRNFEGLTAADEEGNTAAIFENKAKHLYDQLPEMLKPTEKYNNRKQLLFDKIRSSWEVRTASKEMGRSRTVSFFHGSEVAFWRPLISDVQASLGESLTKGAIQIFESTANGLNEFKDLWDSDTWINCFYEWWRTPEYRMSFESDERKEWFMSQLEKMDWIWKRCKWLLDVIGLDLEQVYWYYLKWESYIDKEKIKQEYPCSDKEAFLSSGRPVFEPSPIIERIEQLKIQYAKEEPLRGSFIFEWNDPDHKDRIIDDSIKFVPNPYGFVTIYEDKQEGYPYVIGGDTKGEGSDKFAATVINNVTGKRVATIHDDMDPDIYTHQMYCLGKHYNFALISIEMNFNTYPIVELERLGYYNQYTRQTYDNLGKKYVKKFGWKTDGNTRPMIISKQIEMLRDNIDLFTDIEMLNECLTFVYDKDGRPDALSGKHDDLLFSDMIANEARSQQTYNLTGLAKPQKTKIQAHKDRLAKGRGRKRVL